MTSKVEYKVLEHTRSEGLNREIDKATKYGWLLLGPAQAAYDHEHETAIYVATMFREID